MDIFNLAYNDFIGKVDFYNQLFSNNLEIPKHPGLVAKNLSFYKTIAEIEKYYCFVEEIYNSEELKNTNHDIKLVNLRNIYYSSLELIRDILQLMCNISFYGVNILLRTVLENNIISASLFSGDNEMSERYYEWQIVSLNKINNFFGKLPHDTPNTKEMENKIEKDLKEYQNFKDKYKEKKIYRLDYGWAYDSFKKGDSSLESDPSKLNLEYLTKRFDSRGYLLYKVLTSYVHMTPLQVYTDQLDDLLEGKESIEKNYELAFLYLVDTLYLISSTQIESEKGKNPNYNYESILKINQYYKKQCEETIDNVRVFTKIGTKTNE